MGSQKTSIVGTVTSTIVGSVAVTNAGTFKVQSYPSSTQQITKSGAGSSSTVTIGSGKYARVSGTLSAGANASASSAGVKINGNFAGYITNASVGGFIGNVACGFGPFDLAEGDTVQLVNTLGTNGTADSACNIAIFDK